MIRLVVIEYACSRHPIVASVRSHRAARFCIRSNPPPRFRPLPLFHQHSPANVPHITRCAGVASEGGTSFPNSCVLEFPKVLQLDFSHLRITSRCSDFFTKHERNSEETCALSKIVPQKCVNFQICLDLNLCRDVFRSCKC